MKDIIELHTDADGSCESQASLDFHPQSFDDYLGQDHIKKKLDVYVKAALQRDEPLDHLLLHGPPGLGKTTLAEIMAHLMGVHIRICTGPMLERKGDLISLLTSMKRKDILFIDEIHRMPISVEEILYGAMEHFKVDVIMGQGTGAESITLPIEQFTLIGATTKTGALSAPLRSRFGITERLDYYSVQTLASIVKQSAQFLNIHLSDDSAERIAYAGRGTPRIAKKILKRVRDFIQTDEKDSQSKDNDHIVKNALSCLQIDDKGLTHMDHALLKVITVEFKGGPVGLDTLASITGEDKQTIEDMYEPFLLRQGYLQKTARGRQIPDSILPFLQKKYIEQ
jgi:Holliday junction DNA helicase RuvB